MNQLPLAIVNNILIIQYEEQIKELKKKNQDLQNIVISFDYSCCEFCNKWEAPMDLYETLNSEVICSDCMIYNDLLPCRECSKLDHCDNMDNHNDGVSTWDICVNCK